MSYYDKDLQDIITRMVYVIRPKKELISVLEKIFDSEDLERLARPFVVMTKEHPYERFFESWHRLIAKACKKEFLNYESEDGTLSDSAIRVELGIDLEKDDMQSNFDRWWHIDEATECIEIEPTWLNSN
ncbi:hypothetical protein [Undibacterium sp. TC9W]|uniref:hypothetical protein n=1 Tax=Undibacterium sp. TC9W TaxID=3413053 RepID=UPI003BF3E11E